MPFLRTSLLNAEPAGVLESVDELFALAHAMEQEAASKYDSLAEEMRGQGKDDLAEVFAHLAAAEREHVDNVTQWSQSRRGKRPDPAMVRWEAPEALPPETAAEVKTSQLMTPYRALAIAVRNEERAFAFWSYLAAYSHDPEVKKASEAMAREELGHVATLRKERRRAYHHEHDRSNAETALPRIDAARLERRLAAQLGEMEQRLSGPAALRIRDIRQQTVEMAGAAAGVGSFPASMERKGPLEVAEALVDGYLEGAERSSDAADLERLQQLAEHAISRLAWLRSLAAD
ncbi:rubrerythrin family protein [Bradyrhizobium sp. WBOS7]|uniref:Rubrerythrin family protein n=1 Tax=Bradyrhizobium betae TaxID=244734 RepID=A0AAE9STI0_9BRAD|nr:MULTISPECIES: ferritin family protein [Bradyrhizobium]MDD1572115.1 rubrerythrin family protein [Bradyrhizobium sp. WBOS1]UUO37078.1 rubrerythrin family protein [Bradyrhizobium sp. WBOS01]MDD1528976.1 rubrerythrin family protein [Bradyrhizobium sp. WBOS2]MDD1578247.1 rubrerythrin family protein [Bradyrhizobium sp. WBOS7]MDD1601375.1 rubrerythrin family protein [Bradyrhizobium sp. WBOS16]